MVKLRFKSYTLKAPSPLIDEKYHFSVFDVQRVVLEHYPCNETTQERIRSANVGLQRAEGIVFIWVS